LTLSHAPLRALECKQIAPGGLAEAKVSGLFVLRARPNHFSSCKCRKGHKFIGFPARSIAWDERMYQ
jgi:hypothetical protein